MCGFPGCEHDALARSTLCAAHRKQEREGRSLKPLKNVIPSRPCSVDGCTTRKISRGWCVKHYQRWRQHGSPLWEPPQPPPLLDRIFNKIEQNDDGCWLWQGAMTRGYGITSLGYRKGTRLVHRFLYEHFVGPIPDGLTLDHLCFTPACVNPGHVDPVTSSENTSRAWAAGLYDNRLRNRELKTFSAGGGS